jgi:hypothetical protein
MRQQTPGEGPTRLEHVRASSRLARVLETHRGERHMIAIRGPFSQCGEKDTLWRMVQRTIEDLFLQRVGTTRG